MSEQEKDAFQNDIAQASEGAASSDNTDSGNIVSSNIVSSNVASDSVVSDSVVSDNADVNAADMSPEDPAVVSGAAPESASETPEAVAVTSSSATTSRPVSRKATKPKKIKKETAEEKLQARAHLKMIRMTPQKTRLVANLVRGKDVMQAEDILRFTPRRAAQPILKLLQSAKANAVNNHDMFEDSLYVSQIMVDEGPIMKRFLPRARGRADMLRKRTSKITIVLEERDA